MWASTFRGLLTQKCWLLQQKCTFRGKYFVINDTLAQLDRFCEQCYKDIRHPKGKLTVIGAGSDVGKIACLFLKQQNVIKTLAMYDENPKHKVVAHATDLAHIDTSTAVQAYQGRTNLKAALDNTDVVLICGGQYITPPTCNILDRDLFMQNLSYVRQAALAVSRFAPHAIIAVQTPPVDCNFALIKHTLKLNHVYEKRRLLGVNAISTMRANQLYSQAVKADPTGSFVPVVCGTCRCTRVPVFSSAKSYHCMKAEDKRLALQLLRESDELICRVKSNFEQGHLSIGFATARFVTNIMKGIYQKPTFIDSALVDQMEPDKVFKMESFATPVTVGKEGVEKYEVPKLNPEETAMVTTSKIDLEDMLNLGRCYALGDEYFIHKDKIVKPPPNLPCPVAKPDEAKK